MRHLKYISEGQGRAARILTWDLLDGTVRDREGDGNVKRTSVHRAHAEQASIARVEGVLEDVETVSDNIELNADVTGDGRSTEHVDLERLVAHPEVDVGFGCGELRIVLTTREGRRIKDLVCRYERCEGREGEGQPGQSAP